MGALDELLDRARAPLGPPMEIDLGDGLGRQLAALLSSTNGFAVFNYGIQLFHCGPEGLGPELRHWNDDATWKHTYGTLADGLLCFAQDLFGVQFAIEDQLIVTFDPETADRHTIGESLDDWAEWLLAEPDERGAWSLATAWQKNHGPLDHNERLLPKTFFVFGGKYTGNNLTVSDAAKAHAYQGPDRPTNSQPARRRHHQAHRHRVTLPGDLYCGLRLVGVHGGCEQ
jgi:hypothetical protein